MDQFPPPPNHLYTTWQWNMTGDQEQDRAPILQMYLILNEKCNLMTPERHLNK